MVDQPDPTGSPIDRFDQPDPPDWRDVVRAHLDDPSAAAAAAAVAAELPPVVPESPVSRGIAQWHRTSWTTPDPPDHTALAHRTCPRCRRTSWNPDDAREGYCPNCHDWTGPFYREAYVRSVEQAAARPDPLAALEALVDVPPLTTPQAQGDILVLPWPPDTTPAVRAERVDQAALVTHGGVALDDARSHVLTQDDLPADGSGPRVRYIHLDKGNTRGVLVVEPGAAARLSHPEHPDLRIGPGVYVLHGQRRWLPTNRTGARVTD